MEEFKIETDVTNEFVLSKNAIKFLKEMAKWSYFLSILGFVFLALLIGVAIFVESILYKLNTIGGSMNPMIGIGTGFISGLYLIVALINFFPIYYLFRFSSKMKNAFKFNDNQELNASFEYLKSHYKFIGIMALIFVSFYAVIFFMMFIVGIISAM